MTLSKNIKHTSILDHAKSTKTSSVVIILVDFFTARTIVAIPLSDSLSDQERSFRLKERNNILSKVKLFIDNNLDPSKVVFQDFTIKEILNNHA